MRVGASKRSKQINAQNHFTAISSENGLQVDNQIKNAKALIYKNAKSVSP